MDIITAVVIGAAIAYFAYTLGMKKGAEIARPHCGHEEIAPADEIAPEEESESVRAYRARRDAADLARRHVAFEEAGE